MTKINSKTGLTVTPTSDDTDVSNNSIFIDSSDSNKLKFKDSSGTSNDIVTGTITPGMFIGGTNLSVGSVSNTTDETIIGTVTIPANTFSNYMIIMSNIGSSISNVNGDSKISFNLKIDGITKQTVITGVPVDTVNGCTGGALFWYDASSDFSNEIVVTITGTPAQASGQLAGYCYSVIVMGS